MGSEHPENRASELSILFTGDTEIRKLNRHYRGKDKATDVLSFSAWEGEIPPDAPHSLGDLVISLETTRIQAKRYRWSEADELLRLIVHGVLHLFGYDHEKVSRAAAQRMRRKERVLLGRYRKDAATLLGSCAAGTEGF